MTNVMGADDIRLTPLSTVAGQTGSLSGLSGQALDAEKREKPGQCVTSPDYSDANDHDEA
jgi:hypothetical protein